MTDVRAAIDAIHAKYPNRIVFYGDEYPDHYKFSVVQKELVGQHVMGGLSSVRVFKSNGRLEPVPTAMPVSEEEMKMTPKEINVIPFLSPDEQKAAKTHRMLFGR